MNFKSLKYAGLAIAMIAGTSQAQKVLPTYVGTAGSATGKYTISMGAITFKTEAAHSGRITNLQYNGSEVLSQDSSASNSAGNYGSTFWPSPQAYWTASCKSSVNISCFPPLTALDGNTDTVAITADSTVAYSTPTGDTYTKLRFGKKYWGNVSDSSINIQYTMYNTSSTLPDTFSAWEDTRIPAGGLYVFQSGPDTTTGALAPLTRDSLGFTWFKYDSTTILTNGTNKFYRLSGPDGWYAHIDPHRVLFIKKFTAYPRSQQPPVNTKEKQIEFYANNTKSLIEMELQGPFLPIAPSDSMVWNEKWYARKIPDSMSISVGNPAIIALINQITSTGTTAIANRISQSSFAPAMDYSNGRVSLNMVQTSNVSLTLVNSRGQVISQIHSGMLSQGRHDFSVQSSVPKGIYWLLLKSADQKVLSSTMVVRL